MDQPPNTSHPQSHQQFSEGTASYDNLFSGIAEYAFLDQNEDPNYDSLWDNNSNFAQSDQQHSYTPQNTTSWGHNQISASNESALPQYESLRHQTTEANAYPQPMFNVRPASQNQFDPRSFSRPSHSPTPYNSYAFQQPITFNTAPNYASSNEFAVQSPHAGARRSPMPQPTFQSDLGQPQYMSPYGMRQTLHPGFQSAHMGRYVDQPDQERRQTTNVVDPRFLNPTDFQTSQLDQMQNNFQTVPEILPNATGTAAIQQRLPKPQGSVATPPLAQKAPLVIAKAEKPAAKPRAKKDPNAPKRPRGRPRKDGTGAVKEGSITGSTDDSESDELEIEQAPEPMPAILIPPRSDQVEQKVIYEACLAVWSPRNLAVPAKKVSEAVKTIGELFKGLRDQWKTQNELLKRAELANTAATPSLKADVARLRQQAEAVASKVIEYGHPSLLPHLGNNPYTLSALQSFLLDRVNAGDNDGILVISILKLMKSFTSMTMDLLAKTKNDKILIRLTKKAAADTKRLSQIVLDNATAAERRKSGSTTPPSIEQAPISATQKKVIPQVVIDRNVEPTTGAKRPNDQSNLPASKRSVIPPKAIPQASKPLALQSAAPKRPESAPQQKPTMPIINGISPAAGAKSKPSVAAPAPKPATNIFSALSAAKKPGTSNAARAAAAAKEKSLNGIRTELKKESSPPSALAGRSSGQPAFSFAQTLAGLDKPKETEEKKAEDLPQETEEERAKRLRKEARKKLRVSWRPDASLTDVRIFEHDPDEEIGRVDSMRRDIDDVGGEGRMLKKHKEMDDLDEDEESRANGEDLSPYSAPTEIDFCFDPEPDTSGNFFKRGGSAVSNSPECAAQDRREETTLMVVYTSPSDAPATPKEPSPTGEDEDEDDYSPPTAFGEPSEQTAIRAREAKFYSSMAPRSQTPNATQQSSTQNMSSILDIVGKLTQQRGPSYQPQPQQTFAGLPQGWNNQFQQPQQQPQQNSTSPDLSRLFSLVQQSQNQQQVHAAQPPPQPSQPSAPATQNLAAMLAALQNPGNQGAQPNVGGYSSGNPNPYPGTSESYAGLFGSGGNFDANGGGTDKKKKAVLNVDLGKNHPKAKTVACRYWKEGKCKKGDDCTFKHDDD